MCIRNNGEKIMLKSYTDVRFHQEQVECWKHKQNDWSMSVTFNAWSKKTLEISEHFLKQGPHTHQKNNWHAHANRDAYKVTTQQWS